jgi:hypothetical protein
MGSVLGVLVGLGVIAISQAQIRFRNVEIIVETAPRAVVFLDGQQRGQAAPDGRLVIDAPPGEHNLEVKLPGKRPFQQKFKAVAGTPFRVRAELIDYAGGLEVFTIPNAEVSIDGKPAGLADGAGRLFIGELKSGYHTVRVGRAGYSSEERGLYIEADLSGTVTIDLKRIEASAEAGPAAPPKYVLHRRLLSSHSGTVYAVFGADSLHLMSCSDWGEGCNHVIFWDASTGRQLRTINLDSALSLRAVSRDLKWCAATTRKQDQGVVHLIDAETGQSVRRLRESKEAGSGQIVSVAFGANDNCLASLNEQGWISVVELPSGNRIREWRITGSDFRHLAFSPDGRWLAAGGYQGVAIWDRHTWKETYSLPVKDVVRVRFSPDSRWIALAAEAVSVFEVATGKSGRKILTLENQHLQFLPGSRFIASLYGNNLQFWDRASGLKVAELAIEASDFDFSRDGQWLAVGSGWPTNLEIWRRTE